MAKCSVHVFPLIQGCRGMSSCYRFSSTLFFYDETDTELLFCCRSIHKFSFIFRLTFRLLSPVTTLTTPPFVIQASNMKRTVEYPKFISIFFIILHKLVGFIFPRSSMLEAWMLFHSVSSELFEKGCNAIRFLSLCTT